MTKAEDPFLREKQMFLQQCKIEICKKVKKAGFISKQINYKIPKPTEVWEILNTDLYTLVYTPERGVILNIKGACVDEIVKKQIDSLYHIANSFNRKTEALATVYDGYCDVFNTKGQILRQEPLFKTVASLAANNNSHKIDKLLQGETIQVGVGRYKRSFPDE
jgi:hypothetical protein